MKIHFIRTFIALILLLLSIAQPSVADSPPSFEPFEAVSSNGRFTAVVARSSEDSSPWMLTVYKNAPASGLGRIEVWSCPCRYSGYPGALVSDDGRSVVYLEGWYYPQRSVIDFYHSGKLMRQVKGKEIAFDRTKTLPTASHQSWLFMSAQARDGEARIDPDGKMHFRTIDGRVHTFSTEDGFQVMVEWQPEAQCD